jgi:hypothetical protein
VSFERNYKLKNLGGVPAKSVVEKLELFLTELALLLRDNNYLIGHIKGYVNFDKAGGVGLSIVKSKVNLKPQNYDESAAVTGFKLALTNIVFKIHESELSRLVDLGIGISLPEGEFEIV